MNKWIVIVLGILLPFLSVGQGHEFQYNAKIERVRAKQFYKLYLSPEITSHLNQDFSDIRLYTNKGQETPYILVQEKPVSYKTLFKEYKIVSQSSTEKSTTTLILQNTAGTKINNISLLIKNTAVHKRAKLSGSNDSKTWYSIEDNYTLQPVNNATQTAEVKILNFPLSDYTFYKLDINDSLQAPINILKAGYYDTYAENGKYTEIPGLTFWQQDSTTLKQTFVRISLAVPAFIDKLEVKINKPTYYLRNARLSVNRTIKVKRGKEKILLEPVTDIQLHSSRENVFFISGKWPKEFYLVIDNADDLPVEIESIHAYQLNTYLVAELEKEEQYEMQFGNETIEAPAYDLSHFSDKIPATIPLLQAGKPVLIHTDRADAPEESLLTNTIFIWVAIALVIAFLGYMSYQMIRETSKDQ